MPSDKTTSLTYPSDDGSDVDRSSDFWALPTFASSTSAASDQSMVTNDSKTVCEGLRVLVDYSSNSYQQRILEGVTEWCVERIYPRLLAAETAWRDLEALIEQGEKGQISHDALNAALDNIDAVMKKHNLLLDVVERQPDRNAVTQHDKKHVAVSPVRWALYVIGRTQGRAHLCDGEPDLLVGRGHAAHDGEVLCSDLFSRLARDLLSLTESCYNLDSGSAIESEAGKRAQSDVRSGF